MLKPTAARQRLEDALQRQREEQVIILDAMPAMVLYKDRHNRILRANRAVAESVGMTAEEIVGVSAYDLYHPDDAEHYHRDDLEVISSGVPKLGIVEQFRTVTGEQGWVRTDKIPYRNDQGEIVGVIVFAVDITDLKHVEAALERAHDQLEVRVQERTAELAAVVESLRAEIAERKQVEERLELALWATDLGLWDWDVKTDAAVWDRRTMEMVGYSVDVIEPALQTWQNLVHPEDLSFVMKALNAHVFEQRSPDYEVEHRVRHTTGEYRWILARGKIVERAADGSAVRVIGTLRDITTRKRIEEEMRRQQAELAHVLRLQTIEGIAAELAHEINQPLGAIANFANGLAARLRKGALPDAAMLDAAEQIGAQALRAGHVLQRLRDFTRKGSPRRLPCDVNRLARDAAYLIESDVRRHQIALRLSLDAHLPVVMVDGIQVEQVILNLLRNGVDAIAEAGRDNGALHIATALGATGEVQVMVHDTGNGIPPSVRERLCEPFFTTKRDGLGMGLAISRSIIEAHGGHLDAMASRDGGATLRFTLPPFDPDPQ